MDDQLKKELVEIFERECKRYNIHGEWPNQIPKAISDRIVYLIAEHALRFAQNGICGNNAPSTEE